MLPVTSGLLVHLESAQMPGFSDNDPVGQWSDLSGNGYHVTAAGADRPTYKADNGRGFPCVRFASPQYLTFGNPFSLTSTVTMICVFNATQDGQAFRQTLFGQRNTALALSMEINGTIASIRWPARGVITTGINLSYATSGNSARNITETFVYRKSGAGAGTHTIRVNGRALVDEVDNSGAVTGNGIKDIGRRNTASQHFVGDMFAFLIYDRALTNQEIADVEQYLMGIYQTDQYELQYLGTGNAGGGAEEQGVAWDGSHYYMTTTGTGVGHLRKYTRPVGSDVYTQVLSRELSADWVGTAAGCTQANGINYYNGYLWVGGNNYPTTPEIGYIFQYDPSDFSLVNVWQTSVAKWCEGGAWYDVGDGNGVCFWTVYHNSHSTEQYDSAMNLIATHTKPTMDHQYTNDQLHQGAVWFTDPVNSFKFLIAPCHEAGDVNAIDIFKWNGTGFDGWQRMEDPVTGGQQGNHWGRLAGATPNFGDEMVLAKRSPGEGIQRTSFQIRGIEIVSGPSGATKNAGQSVTFSVVARGSTNLTYQWRKGGVAIGGATSANYTIPSLLESDAGNYDVLVSNANGSVPTEEATLTVNPAATSNWWITGFRRWRRR